MKDLLYTPTVSDIRLAFTSELRARNFVVLPGGVKTVELRSVTFVADEPTILGAVNDDYVAREIKWYESQVLNVNAIPGGAPAMWKKCAAPDGSVNSNYGWMVFSTENGDQYNSVLQELKRDPYSRRAIMVYTRPSMHVDQNRGGMQDFCCTNTVQFFIRNGELQVHVSMRSNDAWAGYRNDRAWHEHVQTKLAHDLGVTPGRMTWTAGSLHFYSSQFWMIDGYWKTRNHLLSREEYTTLIGHSGDPE